MFIQLKNHYWAKGCGENYFVFHAINGEPFLLTPDIFDKLKNDDIDENLQKNLEEVYWYKDNRLYELNYQKALNHIDNYDGPIVLDLVISENCNLSCHMCSHAQTTAHNDLRIINDKLMSFETAKLWVDYYIDYYQIFKKLNKYIFHYGAAEPLINKKVFLKILEYIHSKTVSKSLEVEQLVNTNLTLLDEEITEYLAKYKVKVSVGLDGLKAQNDRIRITKSGKGTYDIIVGNIKRLTDKGVSVGVALTLTERNFNDVIPKDFLEAMKSVGVKTVLVDSDFIHRISFSGEEITNKLMEFYQAGDESGVEIIGSWRTPFANLTTENNDEPKSFCTSLLGKNLTVTPSKHLTFCTYSGTPMSSYSSEDMNKSVKLFIDKMKELMRKRLPTLCEYCQNCVISGHCSGGCYLTYEVTNKNNMMCDIYINATSKLVDYKYGKEVLL